jgi:hypothetical protein
MIRKLLRLSAPVWGAIAQDTVHLACETLPLILGQRTDASPDMPLDRVPIVAVALCRFAANSRQGDKSGMHPRYIVHI